MSEHKETSVLARFASPLIVLATIIWGSSFVVMKSSVDVLPTFWLLAIRFTFSALVLAVVFIKRWKVLDRQYLIGLCLPDLRAGADHLRQERLLHRRLLRHRPLPVLGHRQAPP